MLASRNVSYDDQNCRPSYRYSYDNIGNRKTAQEIAEERHSSGRRSSRS